ncbi:MAG: protein kinase [Myxococcales bacterium]|nr:protein kinase [Myxococcales bacterium]
MGEVWHGVHRDEGVPVAVKVITGQFATEPAYQEGFRREVEAVAGMSHPGITTIYDFGLVSPERGDHVPGLIDGSPWFAMELATRGALTDMLPLVDWPTLRWVLVDILDALAHAHARGVIHRDLKPQNVLVTDDPREKVKLKLTDFGVAIALRHDVSLRTADLGSGLAAGTPYYMPPEQFEARWREMGPWSDLYSLGCVAWQLCCGRPPFSGHTVIELALKHLRDQPPAFVPLYAVPSGLEAWLRRLLKKFPIDRFQFAADAAWALAAIDTFGASSSGPESPTRHQPARHAGAGSPLSSTPRDTESTTPQLVVSPGATLFGNWLAGVTRPGGQPKDDDHAGAAGGAARRRRPPTSEIIRADAPPTPADWRTPFDREIPIPLAGAGIGLFGLREIPFVGREAERDQIWRSFCRVAQTHDAAAVMIRGPVGCGKSRLAEWICQRAHELGAATVFQTTFGAGPTAGQGLARMLTSQMRCSGLSGGELVERVRQVVAKRLSDPETLELDVAALASILQPVLPGRDSSPLVRFASERERYRAIVRYWQVLAVERPLIVWFDDAHLGADGLGLLQHVIDRHPDEKLPALFLLTVNDELLDERILEQELFASLAQREPVETVELQPLSEPEQVQILQHLVRLSSSVAEPLVQRVDGKPLFAVQMLGELIATGALRTDADGFALDPHHHDALPDDIFQLWLRRLGDEENHAETGAAHDLQLAAALGQHVDMNEWACAARHAGIELQPSTVDRLINRGLVQRGEQGWAFTNSVIREAIVRDAKERGRWSALNRAGAAMVDELYPNAFGEERERLARYLNESGDQKRASAQLIEAARQWRELGNYRRSAWLLDERDALALGPDHDEHEALACVILRAQLAETSSELERSIELANRVLESSAVRAYPDVWTDGLLSRATAAMHLGRLDGAREDFARARELADDVDDLERRVRAQLGLAQVARRSARLDEASELLRDAVEQTNGSENRTLEVAALSQFLLLLVARGESQAALATSDRLLTLSRLIGSRGGQITALNSRGEAKRQLREYEGAHDAYREALAILEAIGHWGRHAPRYNIGMLHLLRNDFSAAQRTFEEILAAIDDQHWFATAVRGALLPIVAWRGDFARFDECLAAVRPAVRDDRYVDKDLALCCEWAGDRCAEKPEHRERAIACYQLALKQLQQLQDMERAGQVAARLSALVGASRGATAD